MSRPAERPKTLPLFQRLAALEAWLGATPAADRASGEREEVRRDLAAARQVSSVYREALEAIAALPPEAAGAAGQAVGIARTILEDRYPVR